MYKKGLTRLFRKNIGLGRDLPEDHGVREHRNNQWEKVQGSN